MRTLPRPGKMQPYGRVHAAGLEERAAWLAKRSIKKDSKLWALRTAVSMCDLTTLEGADTEEKVRSLIAKAIKPYTQAYGLPSEEEVACPPVAAVCVYPNLVPFAKRTLETAEKNPGLQSAVSSLQSYKSLPKIASVATGFPSGQTPLSARLAEVKWAIKNGADEIDMVINRNAFLAGDYKTVYKEIEKTKQAMLDAASQIPSPTLWERSVPGQGPRARGEGNNPQTENQNPAHLKVILETGELGSYDAVRNASFIAMHAGADFIKTSTGKIPSAANLPVTLCMLEAIRDFYDQTGMRIGMKPAGGIRTAKQAIHYLVVVKETLGEDWLTPDLFRFGASSLLNDLLAQMVKQLTGAYRSAEEFSEV